MEVTQQEILPRISVGFTGTRKGMGLLRKQVVFSLLQELNPSQAHHGLCKGSDTEFHELVRQLDSSIWIVGHPPIKKGTYVDSLCDERWEEKDYIARDKDIVDCCDVLIATPETEHEVLRSGTWTTVRYARKQLKLEKAKCKKILIVAPNGNVAWETS